MGDVSVLRGPFGDAYEAVAAALRTPDLEGPDVELVFDVPGALNAPLGDGVDVRPLRGGATQAWISVSLELLASPAPVAGLLALASAALDAVAWSSAGRAGPDRGPALRAAVERAASALGLASPEPDRPVPWRRREARTDGRSIEAGWKLSPDSYDADLRRLMAFEDLIDARLRSAKLGSVDGNEVGGGRYEIFVESDHPSEAIELITALADGLDLEAPSFVRGGDRP
jgi:hypothetical protein